MMKFIAEQLSANGGRLGQLSGLQSSPHAVHLTPMVVLTTQVASLPHITEVMEIIELFGYNGMLHCVLSCVIKSKI